MTKVSNSNSRATVRFIFVVVLLDVLGIGVVVPVLPRLIARFVHDDVGVAAKYYGVFIAVYATMQFLFAPILGALSDRVGRRPVILGSLFGAGLDYILFAFAPNLAWMFIGRAVSGITGASFSAATSYIADVTPPERRAQSFGLIGAAFGLGFIIGPALGGILGDVNLRLPFLVAGGLNLLNLCYGFFVLPESLQRSNRRPFSFARANPLGALRNLGRTPVIAGLTGTMMCAYLAQQILQSVWALHTQARFGWSARSVGLSLALVGVTVAVVQGGLVRMIIPALGERRALVTALLFNVTGFIGFATANDQWVFVAIIVPFAIGGLAGPSIQALVSREVSASEQGELQGSLATLTSVAAVLGPLISTRLFARFAPVGAVPRIPGAAFFAAAILNSIGLLLALRLFARFPQKPKEVANVPVNTAQTEQAGEV